MTDLFSSVEEWKYRKRIVQDLDLLDNMIDCLQQCSTIALDTETSSLDYKTLELAGIGVATNKFGSWYIPVGHHIDHPQLQIPTVIMALNNIFEDDKKTLVMHNAKFDLHVLNKFGANVHNKILDTMIMAKLLNKKEVGLKSLASTILDIKLDELDNFVSNKDATEASIYKTAKYCRMDAKSTLALAYIFAKEIHEEKLDRVLKLEMELLPVVVDMESNGVHVDVEKLKELGDIINKKVAKYEKAIKKEAGKDFNVNSTQQLGEILFKDLGIKAPYLTEKNGIGATHTEALKLIEKTNPEYKIVSYVLKYRKHNKLKTTYVDSILEKIDNGKIYPTFNQMGAMTGRFSANNPNLQNIPRPEEKDELMIRNIFYSPEGFKLIVADYSQIELRVLAHFCLDGNLIKAFESGKDVHAATASMMFGVPISKVTKSQRYEAKTLNFGLIYGMGAYSLANRLDKDVEEAEKLMSKYFSIYSQVKPWEQKQLLKAKQNNFVRTLIGRKIYINGLDSEDKKIRNSAERRAVNAVVQGSAADIIKGAMVALGKSKELSNLGAKMIIQVHDELVFECPENNVNEATDIIKSIMEHPFKRDLVIPLLVDISSEQRWGDAK